MSCEQQAPRHQHLVPARVCRVIVAVELIQNHIDTTEFACLAHGVDAGMLRLPRVILHQPLQNAHRYHQKARAAARLSAR